MTDSKVLLVLIGFMLGVAFGVNLGIALMHPSLHLSEEHDLDLISEGCSQRCFDKNCTCEELHAVCDPYINPGFCRRCAP